MNILSRVLRSSPFKRSSFFTHAGLGRFDLLVLRKRIPYGETTDRDRRKCYRTACVSTDTPYVNGSSVGDTANTLYDYDKFDIDPDKDLS